MTIRCKVRCTEVGSRESWNKDRPVLYRAKFSFVSSGSEENKAFFEATPNGQLEVDTVKESHFEVGKEYYLDLTLVSGPEA